MIAPAFSSASSIRLSRFTDHNFTRSHIDIHPHRETHTSNNPFSSTSFVLAKNTVQMTSSQGLSRLRAIFFDLDGTCVNSDHIHYETYRDTLLEVVPNFNEGKAISRELYDTQMAGRQNPELVASILPEMPLSERTALWQLKESRYEEVISKGVPPIRGLVSLLKLCQQHNIQHFIVTNAPKGSCYKTLRSIGIRDFFEEERIIVAEECEFPKPDPAPYLRALKEAGVERDEVMVFEDSPSGTLAAVRAGLFTVGVRSTQSNDSLVTAGATFTVSDYEDEQLDNFMKQYL